MNIDPIGEINSNNLEYYYSGEITVNENTIEIDLNFETKSTDAENLVKI